MIKNKLKIYKNSTLIKNLNKGTETVNLTLNNTDVIYIGYYKELNQLYFEIITKAVTNAGLTFSKSNGTDYTIVNSDDETDGLTKSGFVYLDQLSTSGQLTENGETLNWIKIENTNGAVVSLRLLDLIFNSEDDLMLDEPDIARLYPEGLDSHILSLVASRNYILRKINNSGKYKYNGIKVFSINQYDIMNVDELREASVYYTLYKIFANIQDGENDVYRQKSQDYLDKFNASFQIFSNSILTIDLDDDGVTSDLEQEQSIKTIKFTR